MPDDLSRYFKCAEEAARLAGDVLIRMLDIASVQEKSPKDLVTDADFEAQRVIKTALLSAFPDHLFIGEEDVDDSKPLRLSDVPSNRPCWVVDPIDGTANYVHRLPNFAVSIALVIDGQPRVGIVYDPMADELFSAMEGGGAMLNSKSIKASRCRSLSQALVAASFPPNVKRDSIEVQQFLEVLVHSQSIRRLGSAALNLCYVACGRLDGYWAGSVQPWDIAGGALIACESGAHLTRRDGSPFRIEHRDLTIASTLELHQQLVACLSVREV